MNSHALASIQKFAQACLKLQYTPMRRTRIFMASVPAKNCKNSKLIKSKIFKRNSNVAVTMSIVMHVQANCGSHALVEIVHALSAAG